MADINNTASASNEGECLSPQTLANDLIRCYGEYNGLNSNTRNNSWIQTPAGDLLTNYIDGGPEIREAQAWLNDMDIDIGIAPRNNASSGDEPVQNHIIGENSDALLSLSSSIHGIQTSLLDSFSASHGCNSEISSIQSEANLRNANNTPILVSHGRQSVVAEVQENSGPARAVSSYGSIGSVDSEDGQVPGQSSSGCWSHPRDTSEQLHAQTQSNGLARLSATYRAIDHLRRTRNGVGNAIMHHETLSEPLHRHVDSGSSSRISNSATFGNSSSQPRQSSLLDPLLTVPGINAVPSPPASFPGFQAPFEPEELAFVNGTIHQHMDICFHNLHKQINDNTDKLMDKFLVQFEAQKIGSRAQQAQTISMLRENLLGFSAVLKDYENKLNKQSTMTENNNVMLRNQYKMLKNNNDLLKGTMYRLMGLERRLASGLPTATLKTPDRLDRNRPDFILNGSPRGRCREEYPDESIIGQFPTNGEQVLTSGSPGSGRSSPEKRVSFAPGSSTGVANRSRQSHHESPTEPGSQTQHRLSARRENVTQPIPVSRDGMTSSHLNFAVPMSIDGMTIDGMNGYMYETPNIISQASVSGVMDENGTQYEIPDFMGNSWYHTALGAFCNSARGSY